MTILTFQSHVVAGHVGNAAAVFPLQRLGHDTLAIPTVLLSSHTGHAGWGGGPIGSALLSGVIDGLDRQGALAACRGVLTGYLPDAASGALAERITIAVRERDPAALYLCDPVMGDRPQEAYVPEDVRRTIADRLAPLADILTPNVFELGLLTESDPNDGDLPALKAAARGLWARYPTLKAVVVTGVKAGNDRQGVLLVLPDGGVQVLTIPTVTFAGRAPNGTGDLLAALILGYRLGADTPDLPQAVERALGAVHGVLAETARLDRDELALIAAQALFPLPPTDSVARTAI